MRLLSSLVFPFLFVSTSFAGTLTHTAVSAETLLPASIPIDVPRFDPALGQLDQIDVHLVITMGGTFGVENVSVAPTYPQTSCPWIDGSAAALGIDLNLSPWQSQYSIPSLDGFDGTIDFAGTSGSTFAVPFTFGSAADELGIFSAIARDACSGTGLVHFDVDAHAHTGFYFAQHTEALTGTATLTLTYHYSSYPSRFCFQQDQAWCPCGGGAGCANSHNANGADLVGAGTASISADTLTLSASGLPPSSACLLFQGTSSTFYGSILGDGRRCVGGSIGRLGVTNAVAGALTFPAPGGLELHLAGAVPQAGGFRAYQVWYRDPTPFCSSATFNLTPAVGAFWQP